MPLKFISRLFSSTDRFVDVSLDLSQSMLVSLFLKSLLYDGLMLSLVVVALASQLYILSDVVEDWQ